jgi:hypothetical protein
MTSRHKRRAFLSLAALAPVFTFAVISPAPAFAAGDEAARVTDPVLARQADQLVTIDRIARIVDDNPDIFAGHYSDNPGRVTVYTVSAKAGESATKLAEIQEIATTAAVQVDRKAQRRSLTELRAIETAVRPDRPQRALGGSVIGTQIDPRTNTVNVVTDADTVGMQRQAVGSFGDAVVIQAGSIGQSQGRTDDSEPWWGGSQIIGAKASGSGNGACTSGFALTNLYGEDFMITAGHCFRKGATVTNGGDPIGTVVHRNYPDLSNLDNELIGGQDYGGAIWTGPPMDEDGQTGIRISRATNSCDGCHVYYDGAVTGQKLATLAGPPFCRETGLGYACSLQKTTSGDSCNPGDSGGPIFAYDGRGGAIAVGIHMGKVDGVCTYTQVPDILHAWQSTIKVG